METLSIIWSHNHWVWAAGHTMAARHLNRWAAQWLRFINSTSLRSFKGSFKESITWRPVKTIHSEGLLELLLKRPIHRAARAITGDHTGQCIVVHDAMLVEPLLVPTYLACPTDPRLSDSTRHQRVKATVNKIRHTILLSERSPAALPCIQLN